MNQEYIIFSNATPNDQDGIIPNEVIDFSRFFKNPVMLYRHGRDPEYLETPIGRWEDIHIENGNYIGKPIFSSIRKVKKLKTLFDEGNLKAASIGGLCVWKTTGKTFRNANGEIENELYVNNEGFKVAEYFLLYEITLCPLPSNMDAVGITRNQVQLYSNAELTKLESIINKQNNNQKSNCNMENTNEEKTIGQVIANGFKQAFSIFESESETKRKERAEAEKKEAEEAKAKKEKKEAEESEAKRKLESDAEAKKKLEAEDEGKAEKFAKKIMEAEDEDEYEAAKKEAAKHFECKEAELPPVIKKAIEKKEASFKEKKEAENEAKKKEFESLKKLFPQMKNIEEMQTAYKMAQKPTKVSVGAQFEGVTYTELNAAGNKEGKKLIDSVKRSMGSTKDLSKHQILLSAILNDPKFSVFLSKFRVNTKDAGGNLNSTFDTMELARRVMTGDMDSIATNGRSGKFVQLSGSDSFLATPDTLVVEFLPLIIPYLFASTSWKRNITMFPAKLTSESHGLIWANNAAQPAIYEGTQPSNPANYTIADTPVSLALPAFFLQPMLWNPLYTAQLRYDQVSVQWEQALRKMMEAMDDYLIYTLASAVPVSSHILTTGASFAAGESPNIFKLNPSFIGSLLKPQLIDTLSITQLYDNQNFPDGTEHDLILDPIMKKYILEDPLTQSKLTTLLTEDGKTLVQYADTVFGGRSKVALYDLNSKTVINPNGIIPPNSVGAALDLIGTEAGIGVANFDVFMQQDPTNYGIKMSAETRMGANLLRANGYGSALYIYNPASSIY